MEVPWPKGLIEMSDEPGNNSNDGCAEAAAAADKAQQQQQQQNSKLDANACSGTSSGASPPRKKRKLGEGLDTPGALLTSPHVKGRHLPARCTLCVAVQGPLFCVT